VITSRQLGAAFTWMRPDDLVFSYVVNNYVLGERPPTFDILAWNADGTNLPAALHNTFLDIFQNNSLTKPGALTALGTSVDLSQINLPTFVTGAISDHLTPWKACYRTTQLVGGDTTFVLSYSGHIASLINPPGNPKAHYWQGGPAGADAAPGAPRPAVTLSQDVDSHRYGATHTVAATVTAADGTPVPDGTIVSFGITPPAPGSLTVGSPVVDLGVVPGGTGGWLLRVDGSVTPLGTAPGLGDAHGQFAARAVARLPEVPEWNEDGLRMELVR